MPSPVAHIAGGIATFFVYEKGLRQSHNKTTRNIIALGCLFLAIWPDLDFIPGIFTHDINKYHHGITHSLAGSLLLSSLVVLVTRLMVNEMDKYKVWGCYFMASLSHPLFDYFSVDTTFPYGIPLLWPINDTYYISSVSLFYPIEKRGKSIDSFVLSLINVTNAKAVFFESIFVLILFFILFKLRK